MARPKGIKYIETPEKLWELDLPKAKEIMIMLYNLNIEKDASDKNI